MTHCTVGEPKVVNVILSEAKNLVLVRDAVDMPRSFAALRMTICRSFVEKIDTPEKRESSGRRRNRPTLDTRWRGYDK